MLPLPTFVHTPWIRHFPATPSFTVSPTSPSCAGRPTLKSWSSARQKQGYAALAITDECSLAGVVRAHVAAKELGFPLIIGSEFRITDGPRVVLLAPHREAYGSLSELITTARRRGEKGSYRITWDDLERGVDGCLALLVPDHEPQIADAHRIALAFPYRAWIAVELFWGPNDHARLEMLEHLGRVSGLPLVAAGDVHMHVRSRQRLQDTLTAIRLGTTVSAAGFALYPNAERHLRHRLTLERIYPPELLAETAAHRRALHVLAGQPALRIPRGGRPRRRDASELPAHLDRGGTAFEISCGHARRCPPADRARAGAHRRTQLRALFPHRLRHRAVCPRTRDPLPGAGLRRQFSRLLCPGRHRSRSLAHEHAV